MHTARLRGASVVTLTFAGMVPGCATTGRGETGGATASVRFASEVQAGEMRLVMREGKTEPRVRLADFAASPGVWAVGAMAGLHGEITIANGEVWVTRVVEGEPVTDGPDPTAGAHATLLTGFRVERWDTILLAEGLAGESLEDEIERAALARGIAVASAFPFRIDGGFSSLEMHIINGYCPHAGHGSEAASRPWTSEFGSPVQSRVVGVFARGAEGVLTHHGVAVHAHALVMTPDGPITGHIDSMTTAQGAVLLLPASP